VIIADACRRCAIATLALLLWPIGLAIVSWQTEIRFEARPVNDLIHRARFWMLMFLLLSLAVTPLRRIARYGQLVDVPHDRGRRLLLRRGASFALHPGSGVRPRHVDERDRVAGLSHRRLHALLGLATLGGDVDRWNGARARRPAWRRLHQLVYLVAVLGSCIFSRQTKLDESVPTLVTGLFTWLAGYRLSPGAGKRPGELPTCCCWR